MLPPIRYRLPVKPPVGAAWINTSHPLARNLEFAAFLAGHGHDVVSGELGTPVTSFSGTVVGGAKPGLGVTTAFNGDTSHVNVSGLEFSRGIKRTTWSGVSTTAVMAVQITTLANIDQPFFTTSDTGSGGATYRAVFNSGVLTLVLHGNLTVTFTAALATGTPYIVGMSMDGASPYNVNLAVVNLATGALTTETGTGGIVQNSSGTYAIGNSGVYTSVNGHVGLVLFSTAYHAMESLVQWVRDPLCILAPIPRRYAINSVAASTTFRRKFEAVGTGLKRPFGALN